MSKIDQAIKNVKLRETCEKTSARLVKSIERLKRRAIAMRLDNWEQMTLAEIQRALNSDDKKRHPREKRSVL